MINTKFLTLTLESNGEVLELGTMNTSFWKYMD